MPALGPVAGLPIASLWGSSLAPVIPDVGPESYEPASPIPRGYPHVTVWSDLACRAGVPIRRLPALLDWSERHRLEGFLVTHQWNGTIPTNWEGTTELIEGRVLRVVRRPGDIREYILTTLDDGINTGGITTVMAEGVESLLATMGRVQDALGGAAPSDVVARILESADPWLIPGYIQPLDPLDVGEGPVFGESVGAALRRTAEAIQRRTRTTYEVALVRPDEEHYHLQMAIYREHAPVVDLPTGVAALSLARRRTLTTRMSRAFDATAGMADSYWMIEDVNDPTVDLVALDGGIGLAIEGGQWVGAFLESKTGVRHEILDSEVLTPQVTRLTLDTTTDIDPLDLVRLVADASGGPITEAVLPSAEAALPRPILRAIASGTTHHTNFAPSPTMAEWDGDIPRGWTVETGSVVRTSTVGDYYTGGGAALMIEDQSRMIRWRRRIYYPTAGIAHAFVRVRVDALNLVLGATGHPCFRISVLAPRPVDSGLLVDSPLHYQVPIDEVTLGEWITFRRSIPFSVPAPGHIGNRLIGVNVQNFFIHNDSPFGTTNRCRLLLDACMLVVSSDPAEPPFLIGSGPARAIQQANLDFLTFGGPQQSLTVDPIDLARLDPEGAGHYRTLRLGARTRILGRGLGVDQELRVLDHLEPGRGARAQLTLDTRPALLSRTLAARL